MHHRPMPMIARPSFARLARPQTSTTRRRMTFTTTVNAHAMRVCACEWVMGNRTPSGRLRAPAPLRGAWGMAGRVCRGCRVRGDPRLLNSTALRWRDGAPFRELGHLTDPIRSSRVRCASPFQAFLDRRKPLFLSSLERPRQVVGLAPCPGSNGQATHQV